jgi:hypothetical protein
MTGWDVIFCVFGLVVRYFGVVDSIRHSQGVYLYCPRLRSLMIQVSMECLLGHGTPPVVLLIIVPIFTTEMHNRRGCVEMLHATHHSGITVNISVTGSHCSILSRFTPSYAYLPLFKLPEAKLCSNILFSLFPLRVLRPLSSFSLEEAPRNPPFTLSSFTTRDQPN